VEYGPPKIATESWLMTRDFHLQTFFIREKQALAAHGFLSGDHSQALLFQC
jgi:hypothetical protein